MALIPGWNDLPKDILPIIGEHLENLSDYIRFRAVCASCRSTLPKWPKHQYYQVPRLMIPHKVCSSLFRGFFNPLNQEIYCPDLSEVSGRCLGSSNGWLVLLDNSWTLKLFNPLTKLQLQLPSTSSFPDPYLIYNPNGRIDHQTDVPVAYVHKICLLHSKDHFIAVAIYNVFSKIAFTKLGDDKWTAIPTSDICDCILFHEKIYALTKFQDLVVSPIDDPTQVAGIKVKNMNVIMRQRLSIESTLYLVGRDDELLMVERLFKVQHVQLRGKTSYASKTVGFNLYKLDWVESRATWSKIYNLDGCSIFLGLNTSLCISSKDCPKLRGNQIFYTNDSMELERNTMNLRLKLNRNDWFLASLTNIAHIDKISYTLKVWVYETISTLSVRVATRLSDDVIPRLLRWSCTYSRGFRVLASDVFDNTRSKVKEYLELTDAKQQHMDRIMLPLEACIVSLQETTLM
ncbi:putative F-box protein At4g17565 [Momordica charantia]|uniref:F-box protein At4g17565 n=1 Tax=Momordica charantia TaxID=3673 RepID=A0A6J1DUW8_MOMCH|nr:putative F-box protein At4g17565 [Momordica charantia]